MKQSAILCQSSALLDVSKEDRTLEDLEILQVGILGIDVKLHPGHWDIEVDTIEDLAESRAVESEMSVCRRGVW